MLNQRKAARNTKIGTILTAVVIIFFLITITGCSNDDYIISKGNEIASDIPTKVVENTVTPIPKDIHKKNNDAKSTKSNAKSIKYKGKNYKIVKVDGGNMSGKRLSNVAVDIGYGNRVYWGLTNKYGQLVYVLANKITLQDDKTEPVTSSGRYYNDEAKVPGTERDDLDQGHVIADSLGGVSNAYNITPQNSTLNRHGDQAYMEKNIRDTGGCTYFKAVITYPDIKTQIPSHYHFTYTLKGNDITEDFDNVDPDKVNAKLNDAIPTPKKDKTDSKKTYNIDAVDTNHDGRVTIAEAKVAGYKMPITKNNWLYKYMDDRDGNGKVGE